MALDISGLPLLVFGRCSILTYNTLDLMDSPPYEDLPMLVGSIPSCSTFFLTYKGSGVGVACEKGL
jgi:hypothetical protein